MSLYQPAASHPDSQCYCLISNPDARGGWLAHPGGERHPVHLECAREALRYGSMCPMGCGAMVDRPSLGKRLWTHMRIPKNQVFCGIGLVVVGLAARLRAFVALGFCLQNFGIERAIVEGGGHIPVAREIRRLAEVFLANPADAKANIHQIAVLAARHPPYQECSTALMDNTSRRDRILVCCALCEMASRDVRRFSYLRAWSHLSLAATVLSSASDFPNALRPICRHVLACVLKSLGGYRESQELLQVVLDSRAL